MLPSELEENTEFVGAFLGENPNPDFRIQKWILCFLGQIQKTDHESIKSTLWVDSSDQIQIWIFEIHNLSVFWGGEGGGGRIWKSIFDKRFSPSPGTPQMPYMYDILTEPMLMAP